MAKKYRCPYCQKEFRWYINYAACRNECAKKARAKQRRGEF